MPEIIKLTSKSSGNLLILSEIIEENLIECYQNILSKEQIEYILQFIGACSLKNQILLDSTEYFYIKKEKDYLGFLELNTNENILEISSFYLLQKYQSLKYGKKILEKIKNIAKEKNCHKIQIYINEKLTNSIEIFEHWNFKNKKEKYMNFGNNYFIKSYLLEYFI